MIKIGGNYELTADKYQFILNTRSDGKDKDGNKKDKWSQTYHATFDQAARAIIDNEAKKVAIHSSVADLDQFMAIMNYAVRELADSFEAAYEH